MDVGGDGGEWGGVVLEGGQFVEGGGAGRDASQQCGEGDVEEPGQDGGDP